MSPEEVSALIERANHVLETGTHRDKEYVLSEIKRARTAILEEDGDLAQVFRLVEVIKIFESKGIVLPHESAHNLARGAFLTHSRAQPV